MRRRGFIAVLGGAAAWPIVARAQQQSGIRRIAVLMGTAEDADGKGRLSAFQQGLHDLNWVEGRNVSFAIRWGGGNAERTKAFAAELVGLAPDVILATNTPTARALKQATDKIPIVFAASPIRSPMASLPASRTRRATLPALPASMAKSPESGCNCSGKYLRASSVLWSFTTLTRLLTQYSFR